jgi:GGDEF domain-containing protein
MWAKREVKMDKQKSARSQKLFFFVILLVLWGMASLVILINYVPSFSLIAVSLLVFLIIFSLTDLFPFAPWVGFILSAFVFTGVVYSLLENTQLILVTSGIGVGIFLVTTFLIVLFNHQIHQISKKHDQLQQVIDSLVIYDRNSLLMRWKFAKQALTTEILRGRRYDTKLSMILFEIWNKSQYSSQDLDRITHEMADIIQETIRENIDIAFIGDRIGIILPETGDAGATILTERLIKKFNRSVDARISAGIACFPEDAVTEDEIMIHATQALQVAINTDRELISYHHLEDGDKETGKDQKNAELGEKPGESKTKETTAEEKKVQENLEEARETRDSHEPSLIGSKDWDLGKLEEESTQPIDDQKQRPEEESYIQILKNINLAEDEWVIWVQGFNQMADLVPLEKTLVDIDHVLDVRFLFLQANHLVLRLKSSIKNIRQAEKPFPGWTIQKSDEENKYLLLSPEE